MYIINLTNIYFTLNFRRQNGVGRAMVVSGILEILPGGASWWPALGAEWAAGVRHGWQLTHDGDNGRLTAQRGGGQRRRQEYLTYCWVNDGKGARHNTR